MEATFRMMMMIVLLLVVLFAASFASVELLVAFAFALQHFFGDGQKVLQLTNVLANLAQAFAHATALILVGLGQSRDGAAACSFGCVR